jgi:hypothetical protein
MSRSIGLLLLKLPRLVVLPSKSLNFYYWSCFIFYFFFKNIALKNHPGIGGNCYQCRVKKPPFPSGRWEWIEGAVVNNPVI